MRIGISHNSVAKQKLLREKVFSREFHFAGIYDCHKNIKKEQNNPDLSYLSRKCMERSISQIIPSISILF